MQDSSLVGRKAKDDKLYFSLHWIPGEMTLKKNSMVTNQSREKYSTRLSGHIHKTPSLDSFGQGIREGLTFWQTRSQAIIVHDSVPPDCIEKVISEKGEKTWNQRLSTPRPAPRNILKNARSGHQQQQHGTFVSSRKQEQETHQGGCNSDSEGSTWKHVAKEEDSFQVDLRIQGVSQDAEHKDQEIMTKIQTLVDKLQAGYQTKSIINDVVKKGISNTFSEASRRTIKELGSIALYELGEISKTVPELFKRRNILCLRQNETRKIKNRFEIMSNPLYSIKEDDSRGPRHGPQQWQLTTGKQKSQQDDSEEDATLLWTDDLKTNDTKNLYRIVYARFETSRREESREDVTSRWFYSCNPITCCSRAPWERQKPLDEKLRSELEWHKWNCWTILGSQGSSSPSTTWWEPQEWQERHERQERQDRHGWREWQEWVQLPWAVSHFARFLHIRSFFF